jgi:hypothetical protein
MEEIIASIFWQIFAGVTQQHIASIFRLRKQRAHFSEISVTYTRLHGVTFHKIKSNNAGLCNGDAVFSVR